MRRQQSKKLRVMFQCLFAVLITGLVTAPLLGNPGPLEAIIVITTGLTLAAGGILAGRARNPEAEAVFSRL